MSRSGQGGRLSAARHAAVGVLLGATGALPAAAACPAPAPPAALAAEITASEEAFSQMDAEAMLSATDRAVALVPCLDAALSPELSSALLRQRGLTRWVDDQLESAKLNFEGAVLASPSAELPLTLLPPGHPARQLYEQARTAPPPTIERLRAPAGAALFVNGAPAAGVPAARPALVQVIDRAGAPRGSALVSTAEEAAAKLALEPPPQGPRVGLLVGAGVAGLGAGALLGLSALSLDRFEDPSVYGDDVERLAAARRLNHAEILGAAGLGAAAAGLGVGALVEARW